MKLPPYCCPSQDPRLITFPTSLTLTTLVTSISPVSVSTSTSMKCACLQKRGLGCLGL